MLYEMSLWVECEQARWMYRPGGCILDDVTPVSSSLLSLILLFQIGVDVKVSQWLHCNNADGKKVTPKTSACGFLD